MKQSREFDPSTESVKDARHFVAGELADVAAPTVNSIALMVSELATNCIRHAGTPFSVTVDRESDLIRVMVRDDAAGTPRLRSPTPEENSGRGLIIVQELSDDWGVVASRTGKEVWFTVRTSAPPEPASETRVRQRSET